MRHRQCGGIAFNIGSTVAGVGASNGVVLLFDSVVGASLLATAWALGLLPALPHPSATTALAAGAALVLVAAVILAVPRLRANVRQGVAILAMLAAFGVPATLPIAGLVVVAGGMSTLVPATPGGAGTQQLLIVVALQHVASAASALSFSMRSA